MMAGAGGAMRATGWRATATRFNNCGEGGNAETVFSTLSAATGTHVIRLPDGETGIRKSWICFLQDVLAQHPAIELATDVAPFRFTQWDGKLLREIPCLRLKPGAKPDPNEFKPVMPTWRSNPGPFSTACKSRARSRPA